MNFKQLFTLSNSALKQVNHLLQENNQKFLKITITKGGCAGSTYQMNFADSKQKNDEIVNGNIIIDSKSIIKVVGTNLDYIESDLDSKFVFSNSNSEEKCACGKSFKL